MPTSGDIERLLAEALVKIQKEDSSIKDIKIEGQVRESRTEGHGDFSTPFAMALSSANDGKPARGLAAAVVRHLRKPDWLDRVEIAGPGFINFFLHQSAADDNLLEVLRAGADYGHSRSMQGRSLLLEYVSSNPTGPLHIGHGRGAVVGAALANLYRALGCEVQSEYYVNDRGRQSQVLAVSAWLRWLQLEMPPGSYQGDYVADLAAPEDDCFGALDVDTEQVRSILAAAADDDEAHLDALIALLLKALGASALLALCARLHDRVLTGIRGELQVLGVRMDSWFKESTLYGTDASGQTAVQRLAERLRAEGNAELRDDGALWFRSTAFGDDKDRVLIRANGEPTYFASDIAYHLDKMGRAERLVNIWGSDHHGYEKRLRGALRALGEDDSRLTVLYVQFVALLEGGKRLGMSTRGGTFVSLAQLCKRVSPDAVKLIYMSCDTVQHLDFDLEAAVAHDKNNPAYYIQYAHARICSVERKLAETGGHDPQWSEEELAARILPLLKGAKEVQLRRELLRFGQVVDSSAQQLQPHRMTTYLRDLAAVFHAWYNAERILDKDEDLRAARIVLSRMLKQVFGEGLRLLGLQAPEKM